MSTEIASTPQHPSSTLVNISADADLRLIKLLAPTTSSPSQFESACSDHIANGDAAGLVKAIVAEEGAIGGLFSGEYTVEEAVGAVCLLGALLERVGDETMEGELCASLADVVARAAAASASNEDGSAEKGSACVAALFNLRSNGVEKVRLLTKIVDLADTSSLAPGAPEGYSALADMLESSMLQSSLTLWGGRNDDNSSIPDGEQRALFQAVVRGMDRVLAKLTGDKKGDEAASVEVEVARKIKAAVDRKQTYLMLILETYKEEVSGFAAEEQRCWLCSVLLYRMDFIIARSLATSLTFPHCTDSLHLTLISNNHLHCNATVPNRQRSLSLRTSSIHRCHPRPH